jgi:hypothetical protein
MAVLEQWKGASPNSKPIQGSAQTAQANTAQQQGFTYNVQASTLCIHTTGHQPCFFKHSRSLQSRQQLHTQQLLQSAKQTTAHESKTQEHTHSIQPKRLYCQLQQRTHQRLQTAATNDTP